MADDLFGRVSDIFDGAFGVVEKGFSHYMDYLGMKAATQGGAQNYSAPAAGVQPVYAQPSPAAYPSGSGPFYGVPMETMVLIAGGALVLLVLLRR